MGQWAKKIKRKLGYFGVWADADAALPRYLDEVDEIQAGRDPRRTGVVGVYADTISTYDLCNLYLKRQQRRAESGEVTRRNFSDNLKACRRFMAHFGKFMKAASLRAGDVAAYTCDNITKTFTKLCGKMRRVSCRSWILMSSSQAVHEALSLEYLKGQGLANLSTIWQKLTARK